jgi:protein-disulfide isomerase
MLSKWLGGFALAAAIVLSVPALAAGEFTNDQKEQLGKFIHDYLISHPEIIKDSVEELDRREKVAETADREKTVSSEAGKLFRSPNQAVVGNPDGDVTVVEFFDYNCGYCKQSLANITKLIENDPKLRVILKDFAILGPDSIEVAEVATAARQQLKGPKFWEFHKKLLGLRGHIGKAQAVAVAKELGADTDQLEKDIKSPATRATLAEVETLAEKLHFSGTPSWVIGQDAYVGGLSYPDMKAKVDNVRKCGKAVC